MGTGMSVRYVRLRAFHVSMGLMAALVGLGACLPPAWAQNELFVGNNNTQGFGSNPNSVTVYSRTASGNTAPIRNLSGPATDLSAVGGVFVDAMNDELVVGNTSGTGYVTVYSRMASGDTAPIRTLSGAATGINTPYGVFVDAVNDELVVANDGAPSITVYSRTANGNAAPIRTLMGAATGLNAPFGIFVDTVNNELVVVNSGPQSITVYNRTASGNTAPIRTISGAATGLSFPSGVFVDTLNNELVVGDQLDSVFPFTGAVRIYSRTANGNTPPIRTISGAATGLNRPVGVVVDTMNQEILAANSDGWSVTAYARTANGNAAPLRTLVGASTLLDQPYFLAITIKCKPNKKGKCKTPKPHP